MKKSSKKNMEKDVIHIACSLDDNFVMPTGAMLVSLFETNRKNIVYIHVFSANLKKENIDILEEITLRYGMSFEFCQLDKSIFENFLINKRISLASYYRILIPEIINKNIQKILYLDGDMIINGDISELWNTDLEGFIIGAVNDITGFEFEEYNRIKTPKEFGYFNSGLLLINNETWRANNITTKILNFLVENRSIIKFHDQDGLNGVLFDKRKYLSPVWNFQPGIYYCPSFLTDYVYPGTNFKKIRKHPIIIHFNGIEKPWHYISLHPFTKKFKYYLKLSGLINDQKDFTIKKILKKQAYRFLGWKRINRYFYNKQKKLQYAGQIDL